MSLLFKSGGPKFWSLSFSLSPSNEYSRLISFRNDWLDLLAVAGTLRSLLQLHSSQASILRHSAFFMVQFSDPYMTTGKIIALTRQTFNRILTAARSLYRGTNSGREDGERRRTPYCHRAGGRPAREQVREGCGGLPARAPGRLWSGSGSRGPQERSTSREDSEEEQPRPAGSSRFPQRPLGPGRWLVP